MKFYLLLLIYVLLMLTVFFTGIAYVWYILATVLLLSIIVLGATTMRVNLFLQVQSKIKNTTTEVALTFDDGPDKELTPKVLDLLEKYEAKATFFCIGNKIEGNEALVQRMINEGHSVGNHTYEHSNTFPIWSLSKMKQSIQKTDALISDISGVKSILFRPPFGVTNNLIAVVLKSLKKRTIGWSIRTKDSCKSPDEVMRKIKKEIKPGSIILFHDTNSNVLVELKDTLAYCKLKNLNPIALV